MPRPVALAGLGFRVRVRLTECAKLALKGTGLRFQEIPPEKCFSCKKKLLM